MLAHMSQSKECVCSLYAHSASQQHDMSAECLFCAFTFFFYGCFRTQSMLVLTDLSFLFVDLHAYISFLPCLCHHGPDNALVATLEISLHVNRPMHYLE